MTERQPDAAARTQNGSCVFHRRASVSGSVFLWAQIFTTWPRCALLPKVLHSFISSRSSLCPPRFLFCLGLVLRFWGFHQNLPPLSFLFLFLTLLISCSYTLVIDTALSLLQELPPPLPFSPHYYASLFPLPQRLSFHVYILFKCVLLFHFVTRSAVFTFTYKMTSSAGIST